MSTSTPIVPTAPVVPSARWRTAERVRDLVTVLVRRDLTLRYKRTVLGLGWSLLNPLLQLAVFYFVFAYVLPVATEQFALFLFIGLLSWNWFSSSLQLGCAAITDHASLVRQPGFMPAVLPLVTVLSNLLHFLVALPIVLVVLLVSGQSLTWTLLALPVVIAVQFLFTLSIVYALSALHVSFRDTQYLVSATLLLAFYACPVLYDTARVPERFRGLFALNPLVPVLEGYRDILLHGRWPAPLPLLLVALLSLASLALTVALFRRASRGFVEELGA
jgi:lipopolysaccharide transport system permease protein